MSSGHASSSENERKKARREILLTSCPSWNGREWYSSRKSILLLLWTAID